MRPDGSTMAAIWRLFVWSMNLLLAGVHSGFDWTGRKLGVKGDPIANGWKAALIQVRGDWEFYCQMVDFPQWNGAVRCCWLCRASNSVERFLWTNMGPDAPWRASVWSHSQYLDCLREEGSLPPLLFGVIGLTLQCIHIDVLHTVDQGVASHIIGNVFIECMQSHGTNQEARMSWLQKEVLSWGKRFKPGSKLQGKLTFERLKTDGGWPKLKAKAAATRHLSHLALEMAQNHCSGSQHDRIRVRICDLLVRFYVLLDKEGVFMSSNAQAEVCKLGNDLCRLYAALSAEALAPPASRAWKMVPKFHLFLHLCELQVGVKGNPRYYWTYCDEDLQRHVKEIAQSCHPSTLPTTSMYKWLLLVFEGWV